jgi:hypothetical protein
MFVGVSLNFRNGGVWPSGKGLEPNALLPVISENFPTAFDQPTVQEYKRQAAVITHNLQTFTQKSA